MKKILILFAIVTLGLVQLSVQDRSSKQDRISLKLDEAKDFCIRNNLNTEICVLVDMSIHSGKNRLFVYDLINKTIILEGLCSHGCCENAWGTTSTKSNPIFSNVENSHCSSLGKYKIGQRGYSNWGINVNYKLHGLEESNSNAYERFIVLHSWNMVPSQELYPEGTPEGWGCPAVSNLLMKKLDELLKRCKEPVLFWVYQ